jgi:soluble lytic murein transglycosylase
MSSQQVTLQWLYNQPYRMRLLRVVAGAGLVALLATPTPHAQTRTDEPVTSGVRLLPTAHPALPATPGQYWLAPDLTQRVSRGRAATTAVANLVKAAQLINDKKFAAAVPLIDGTAVAATPLGAYGHYLAGVALSGLERYVDADAAFAAAAALRPDGALSELLPLRISEVALARGDARRAVQILEQLNPEKANAPEQVFLQVARAAERAGDREAALKAYRRLYYDYPLSAEANDAQSGIERLQTADLIPPDRFALELARAERLFSARRWAQARAGFAALTSTARGDDAELVGLRIAECDYYLDRHRAARDELQPYVKDASREAEARFFYLTATRALGDQRTYVELARKFVAEFPESPWSEETLNNLASHYIIVDEDDEADLVFRELARRFPKSRYAERAAWKVGWRAYRNDEFREAAETFEKAAETFPRSDYRPSWLYWSGRARDRVGQADVAASRYRLTIADYANSYYGRLASAILGQRNETTAIQSVAAATVDAPSMAVPTEALIRELAAVELYDAALREVQFAQRVWGNSPRLDATVAWIRHNQGLTLNGTERFNALRGAINTMRRAYPQFMAAGGENLPPEILRIIYPLDFWPLINRGATQHGLDPYLMTALMAQESTFTPEIKSSANAVGLMQLLPSTGRRYARKVGMPRFSTNSLTDPEVNVRLGMQYFKDLVDRFGGDYFAIASYNAGENRVAQWRAEKPDLSEDEFIDDIPFPETQNYVKRILGTAEDYRRLYGGGLLNPNQPLSRGTVTPVKPTTVKKATPAAKKPAAAPKKAAPAPKAATPAKKKAAPAKKQPITRKR